MEFKLVVDDDLIARARQFFRRGGIVLMALLMAVPMLLLARSAMNEYGLTVFEAGKVISSSEVNENFNVLAQQSDALQSSVDSLEAAITVDGNNNVGIGSTSPSANLDVKGNLSKALSGIVSTAKGSTEVTGSDTKFMDELKVGDAIRIGAEVFTVAVIGDKDSLTLNAPPTTSLGGTLAYTDSDLLSIQNGDGAGKVVVDKSGNVGVGSATPTAKLQVDGARRAFAVNGSWGGDDFANPVAKIVSTDSGVTESGTTFNRKNGALNFDLLNVHYQGSSRLFVHSDGKVGIGTTNPTGRLEVAGGGDIVLSGTGGDAGDVVFQTGTGEQRGRIFTNSDANALYLTSQDISPDITIVASGSVGIGTMSPQYKLDVAGTVRADNISVTSDARFKKDISPLKNALEGIKCLQGVSYLMRDPALSPDLQIGLIAQEVEECYPEVVATDDQGYKSVSYDRLVAPLIEALKAQQRTLDVQEARLQRLEAHLAASHTQKQLQELHPRN